MRSFLVILVVFLFIPLANAACFTPTYDIVLNDSHITTQAGYYYREITFCKDVYSQVIKIGIDNVIVNCNDSIMSNYIGFNLTGRTGITVKNCHLVGDTGFQLINSHHNRIIFNNITNAFVGILMDQSDDNIFEHNSISINPNWSPTNGFQIISSNKNTIAHNKIIFADSNINLTCYSDSPLDIWDLHRQGHSYDNKIYNNTFVYGSIDYCDKFHNNLYDNVFCYNGIGNTYISATGPTCDDFSPYQNITALWEDDEDKWAAIHNLETLYDSLNQTVSTIHQTLSEIWNYIWDHEVRITNLEGNMTTTTTIAPTTTTTIPSSDSCNKYPAIKCLFVEGRTCRWDSSLRKCVRK